MDEVFVKKTKRLARALAISFSIGFGAALGFQMLLSIPIIGGTLLLVSYYQISDSSTDTILMAVAIPVLTISTSVGFWVGIRNFRDFWKLPEEAGDKRNSPSQGLKFINYYKQWRDRSKAKVEVAYVADKWIDKRPKKALRRHVEQRKSQQTAKKVEAVYVANKLEENSTNVSVGETEDNTRRRNLKESTAGPGKTTAKSIWVGIIAVILGMCLMIAVAGLIKTLPSLGEFGWEFWKTLNMTWWQSLACVLAVGLVGTAFYAGLSKKETSPTAKECLIAASIAGVLLIVGFSGQLGLYERKVPEVHPVWDFYQSQCNENYYENVKNMSRNEQRMFDDRCMNAGDYISDMIGDAVYP